ncbi:hypothetical protein [Roseovarius nitratireducens]|uniref:hypothetical protein n=1 Tax=Roseovarius nitratireducens TaxID=2044597 RepID=UPI0013ED378F|nr:hypothetical protein [Roseovarius nitratireducens]
MQDLVDTSDFCRECGGTGRLTDYDDRNRARLVACDMCRGTGHRTVLVGPKP